MKIVAYRLVFLGKESTDYTVDFMQTEQPTSRDIEMVLLGLERGLGFKLPRKNNSKFETYGSSNSVAYELYAVNSDSQIDWVDGV